MHGMQHDPAPEDRTNLFGNARFQINSDWQAYVTGMYSHDEVNLVIQPGPMSSLFTYGPLNNIPTTITLQPIEPVLSARDRLRTPASTGSRSTSATARSTTVSATRRIRTRTGRSSPGCKGSWQQLGLGRSAFYAEGKTTQHINGGFQDLTKLLPILNSGVVNFFGPNTPDIVALERTANFVGDVFNGTSKNYGAQVKTSGEIYKLPAGPLALAFRRRGAQGRVRPDRRSGARGAATSPASADR